jgi:hypothetical protein
MSSFLKIAKNGNLYLDGNLITTDEIEDINTYLMQVLGFYTTIDKSVTVDDLMHCFYGLKSFISGYFSEEYETIRAFTATSKLDKKYKSITFYKSFKIESDDFSSDEEDYLYVLPEIKFIEPKDGEEGFDRLGSLPVFIDEKMTLTHNEIELNLKTKFTFLDILTCVFEELSFYMKSGEIQTTN